MPFFSRYTLAGVNAVKEVQVTGDMTDCTKKNGPLQKNANTCQIPQFATRECHGTRCHEFLLQPQSKHAGPGRRPSTAYALSGV